MKINSIRQQQNFKGGAADAAVNFIAKHQVGIAGLAGASVVAQKIVMSGSEAVIAPMIDVGIGEVITKTTNEKDNRTRQSSKTQAIRTHAQATGGTITGVAIRALCIAASTLLMSKLGEKTGSKIGEMINPEKLSSSKNLYKYQENAAAWGKSIGGAAAIVVMMFTNFLLDIPLVNFINKKITDIVSKDKNTSKQDKEVKNS